MKIEQYIKARDMESLNNTFMTLDVSDIMEIHNYLHPESIKFIADHRGQINVPVDSLEHIIWFHYKSQNWTDDLLTKIIEECKKERFIALESIIIHAIKHDNVTAEQYRKIEEAFSDKEIKRQLFFWIIRRKTEQEIELTNIEIERLLELRGFHWLEKAFENAQINGSLKELFPKPKPGEKDRKHKEILYRRAINLKFP